MALAGVAGAVELTTLATMDELVAAASVNTATLVQDMSVTTYEFGNGTYIGSITLGALNTALADSEQYITIAAWIKPTDVNGVESIFGYGAQSDGFKFCTNGAGLQYTAKGVLDRDTAGVGLTADTWTLVGVSFKAGAVRDAASGKYIAGTSNSNFYTRNVGGFVLPGEDDQTFSIGSGNSGGARETFNGQIAGLTIFTSNSVINGVDDITNIIGKDAPMYVAPAVPEPTTATLSLLALAGLAARRRRK